MALLRHGTLFVGISVIALSGCATIPTGPTGLSEVGRTYQEEAQRFERDGRLRDSLERWKIVSAIDPQHPGASQKKTEIEAKIKEQSNRHITAGKELLQRRENRGPSGNSWPPLGLTPEIGRRLSSSTRASSNSGSRRHTHDLFEKVGLRRRAGLARVGTPNHRPRKKPRKRRRLVKR